MTMITERTSLKSLFLDCLRISLLMLVLGTVAAFLGGLLLILTPFLAVGLCMLNCHREEKPGLLQEAEPAEEGPQPVVMEHPPISEAEALRQSIRSAIFKQHSPANGS